MLLFIKKSLLFSALLYLGCLNFNCCFNSIPSYIYDQSCCGVSPYGPQAYYPFMLNSETDPFASGQKVFGLNFPPPIVNPDEIEGSQKAYSCSQILCFEDTTSPVCACNFNTGNVVTFKNNCDVEKHNCRFDTGRKFLFCISCSEKSVKL